MGLVSLGYLGFFMALNLLFVYDFLLTLEGGFKELWEVKPKWCHHYPKNQAKFKALSDYADIHGWNARIVTLPDIEGMEMQVGLRPWKGEGAPWVNLENPDYRPRNHHEQKYGGLQAPPSE